MKSLWFGHVKWLLRIMQVSTENCPKGGMLAFPCSWLRLICSSCGWNDLLHQKVGEGRKKKQKTAKLSVHIVYCEVQHFFFSNIPSNM